MTTDHSKETSCVCQAQTSNHASWTSWSFPSVSMYLLDCLHPPQTEPVVCHFCDKLQCI